MNRRRDNPLGQGVYNFKHAWHAGGCQQVSHVGFNRTDQRRNIMLSKERINRTDFSSITQGGAGCMAFQVIDIFRFYRRIRICPLKCQ